MKDLFPAIVGQEVAKRKLGFYIAGYQHSRIMPNALLVAPKGHGKTFMAKALAANLTLKDSVEPKPYYVVNCSTLKNVRQLLNDIIVPLVISKEVTVLFDEASELPNDVTMMLLSLLNPNKENKNSLSYDDYSIEVDFTKQTFLFATSEVHLVHHALVDRLTRFDLEEYSLPNLGEIMMKTLEGIRFEDTVLDRVAKVLRGNARQAQKMANDILIYLKGKGSDTFTLDNWKEFRSTLGILPLGLNQTEIRLLEILARRKDVKLTALAAIMGMSRTSIQQDVELYLQKNNLIAITTNGRNITANGQDYFHIIKNAV